VGSMLRIAWSHVAEVDRRREAEAVIACVLGVAVAVDSCSQVVWHYHHGVVDSPLEVMAFLLRAMVAAPGEALHSQYLEVMADHEACLVVMVSRQVQHTQCPQVVVAVHLEERPYHLAADHYSVEY
jgi:hypothetical protein